MRSWRAVRAPGRFGRRRTGDAAGELEDAARRGDPPRRGDRAAGSRTRDGSSWSTTEAGPAWRLDDLARERPAVGSLKAPLVGREPELASSGRRSSRRSRAHAAPADDPGDGGDREVEARQELAALAAEQATVLVGRCVPYGEGITFWSCARWSTNSRPRARPESSSGKDTRRGGSPKASRRRLASRRRRSIARRSSGPPEPVRGARPGAPPRRLLRGRSLGRAHVPRPGRVPGGAGAGCADPVVCIAARAARGATRLGQRNAEREFFGARAPSRPRLRGTDRQPRSRSRPGHKGPGTRDRRWEPPVHRAARRHAHGRGWLRGRAPDPPDDRGAVVGAAGSSRAGRARRDHPGGRGRQGVLGPGCG